MNIKPLPPSSYLHECFEMRGAALWWRERPRRHFESDRVCNQWNAKFAWKIAGRQMVRGGYWQVMLDLKRYLNHRVIAAMAGIDTSACIDHIDGDASNNDPSNLRSCTQAQNTRNNVGWSKRPQRVGTFMRKNGAWTAYVRADGRLKNLGTFRTEAEAVAARVAAERIHYGAFAGGARPTT